ncbi:MAG: hypothetical protein QM667_04240 [Asticcacaulis sp.]
MNDASKVKKKSWRGFIGFCLFVLLLVVAGGVILSKQSPVSQKWNPPEGYFSHLSDDDDAVAYGWHPLKPGEYVCDQGVRCWAGMVVFSKACPEEAFVELALVNDEEHLIGALEWRKESVEANVPYIVVVHQYYRDEYKGQILKGRADFVKCS